MSDKNNVVVKSKLGWSAKNVVIEEYSLLKTNLTLIPSGLLKFSVCLLFENVLSKPPLNLSRKSHLSHADVWWDCTIGVFYSYSSETWRSASSKANHWDHKMYLNNQKRHTAFLFFLEEELPLSRFRQGPFISIKIEQFYYPRANFHQNRSQRFNTSQPQPRCHVCAVTNPIWRREL